ncbi:etoposide-induced protein 24 (EI24) [Novosphingobium kunmingense]|uniref:Etoposide-induced protein 24 (EI24) n=1 Tax=Novosphingobium kunmingense TaxID=1211806 RepID=A0A2N0H4W2_9SPHN|nr:EI24 domain-containing protein [Novosphingobium kunmingense]PKB13960.1 etoposide-induced protein 24 (EI24) [Novosphingobium kunmingense]
MLHAFTLALGQMADPRVLRIWLKSLVATLAAFAVLGLVGWWLLDWGLARAGLSEANLAAPEGLRGLIAALGVILGGIVLWRVVALAVLQLFADEVVAAVEAQHYPAAAARARALGWHEELGQALRGAGRAIALNLLAAPVALLLLVTGIGAAAVFTLVNALLLGRELQDMVWLRHRPDRAAPPPLRGYERFMLGLVVAALLLVPFVNFLAPFLGAAAAAHLIHRKDLQTHAA